MASLQLYLRATLQQPSGDSNSGHASSLLTGHLRFSSPLLISLIRARQSARLEHRRRPSPAPEPTSDDDGTPLERRARLFAVELIRWLSGRPESTSASLATQFAYILSENDQAELLRANHFRAILRCVARRRRRRAQQQSESAGGTVASGRSEDCWILREQFDPLVRYLSDNLARCERFLLPCSSTSDASTM